MLTVFSKTKRKDCEGSTRRDFLKVGAIGGGALTLPNLLRAENATPGTSKQKSICTAGGGRKIVLSSVVARLQSLQQEIRNRSR